MPITPRLRSNMPVGDTRVTLQSRWLKVGARRQVRHAGEHPDSVLDSRCLSKEIRQQAGTRFAAVTAWFSAG